MKLEQKNYVFSINRDTASENDSISEIHLKINDKLTTITLETLFLKISSHEFSDDGKELEITGWSVLQLLKETKSLNLLLIRDTKSDTESNNEIKIGFFSEKLGELEVTKISNPLLQFSDKTDESAAEILEKILELSIVKVDEQVGEVVAPHSENSTVIYVNKNYENAKLRYINNGYKEYSYENFRLLKNDEKQKAILVEIKGENEAEQFNNSIIEEATVTFLDKNTYRVIICKIEDEKLIVEISVPEEKLENP